MTCDKVQTRLSAFVDHELSPSKAAEIEAHLRTCESCRAKLAALEALGGQLKAWTVPDVPPLLAERIALRGQQQLARQQGRHLPHVYWWDSYSVPMRAAAVIVLVVGLSVGTLLGLNVAKPKNAQMAANPDRTGVAPDEMRFDSFSDSPNGSPAETYLALATASEGRR